MVVGEAWIEPEPATNTPPDGSTGAVCAWSGAAMARATAAPSRVAERGDLDTLRLEEAFTRALSAMRAAFNALARDISLSRCPPF
jgi:hypothetical protein